MPGELESSRGMDRSKEAAKVVCFLAGVRGQVAVLYGRRGSGKTELIEGWVRPLLAREEPVYYGVCSPALPSPVEGPGGAKAEIDWTSPPGGTILLDDFDQFLMQPERARREGLEKLLAVARSGRGSTTLVLVVSEDSLREILVLRAAAPEIAEHVLELPEVSFEEGLQSLAGTEPGAVSYDPQLLAALKQDLERFHEQSATPRLLEAVHAELRRMVAAQPEAARGLTLYRNAGGLKGILQRHMHRKLEELAESGGVEAEVAGREILVELGAGVRPDLEEIAPRTGIPLETAARALEWLKERSGLLRVATGGRVDLLPAQLAQVIAEERENRQQELGPAQRLLAEGLRGWREVGSELPRDRFENVDRLRQEVRTSAEEAALMAYCALRYAEGEAFEGARYWIARIRDHSDRVAVLVRVLYRGRPLARLGAARLLGDYDEPEVRSELYRAALEDQDEQVRLEAVASLGRLTAGDLRARLEEEAQDPANPYQANAVVALRAFRDPATSELLQRLVSEPATKSEIREKAIDTLAAVGNPEAVGALVNIGLNDEDQEDRERAAAALATIPGPALQAEALDRIRTTRLELEGTPEPIGPGVLLRAAGRLLAALAVAYFNMLFHGLALLALGRPGLACGFFAADVLFGAMMFIAGPEAHPILWGTALIAWFLNLLACQLVALRIAVLGAGESRQRLGAPTVLGLRSATASGLWAPPPRQRLGFRTMLGAVMFLANALTAFLLFHGLAHLLVKRVRRGLILLGLELLGIGGALILLVYPDLFTVADLRIEGLAETLSQLVLPLLGGFYVVTYLVLFFGTFVWDIAVGAYLIFRPRWRVEAEVRRASLYRSVLRRQAATEFVLSRLSRGGPEQARWAKALVRRFAPVLPWRRLVECLERNGAATPRVVTAALERVKNVEALDALQALWRRADARLRRRILRVLGARPSEGSLECLKGLAREAGLPGRLRYLASAFDYRVRLWPKPLLVLGTWLTPLALVLLVEGSATLLNKARPLIKELWADVAEEVNERPAAWRPALLGSREKKIAETAEFLAKRYPGESVQELVEIYEVVETSAGDHLNEIRAALAESLAILASQRFEPERRADEAAEAAVEALGKSLEGAGDAARRLRALKALARIASDGRLAVRQKAVKILSGKPQWLDLNLFATLDDRQRQVAVAALLSARSPEAVHALRELATATEAMVKAAMRVDESVFPDRQRTEEVQRQLQRFRELQLMAMQSLDRMQTAEARQALSAIKASESPTVAPQRAVEQEVRAQLAVGDRKGALQTLTEATARFPDFAWAYYMQALVHFETGDYQEAAGLALRTAEVDPAYEEAYGLLRQTYVEQKRIPEAVERFEDLSRRYATIVYPRQQLAYLYHEYLGNYDRAYEINRQIRADSAGLAQQESSHANFTECNLTTGRYREAAELAAELGAKTGHPEYRVAMPLIAYAALVALGDYREAEKELGRLEREVRSLRPGDETNWVYDGTLNYLRRADLAEPVKTALLKLVGAINDSNKSRKPLKDLPAGLFAENRAALRSEPPKKR